MPDYRENKHPTISWDVDFIEQRKFFIEKVATKLCNHYGVTNLVMPTRLLDRNLTRQKLLDEILKLVTVKARLNT